MHQKEWSEIIEVLDGFILKWSIVASKGGPKTDVAKALDAALYARGWTERKFDTKIVVDDDEYPSPTHKVDCFKNRVALEVEWNNKDPFFDRDLNNFRLLYELRVIDVGVVVTRATRLQEWLNANFEMLNKQRGTYGKSTTHFEKLGPKIIGGGAGGCPVLVFSIKAEAYVDDR